MKLSSGGGQYGTVEQHRATAVGSLHVGLLASVLSSLSALAGQVLLVSCNFSSIYLDTLLDLSTLDLAALKVSLGSPEVEVCCSALVFKALQFLQASYSLL